MQFEHPTVALCWHNTGLLCFLLCRYILCRPNSIYRTILLLLLLLLLLLYLIIVLQTNTFQCILATDGVESFVIFLYEFDGIQWNTPDSSGGDHGLGERGAVAGINGGDNFTYFNIPGSLTPDIINVDQTSNVGIPGVWMFQVGKGNFISIFHVLTVAICEFVVVVTVSLPCAINYCTSLHTCNSCNMGMRAGAIPKARLWELNPHPQLLPSSSLWALLLKII